jgi:hypothetical protein
MIILQHESLCHEVFGIGEGCLYWLEEPSVNGHFSAKRSLETAHINPDMRGRRKQDFDL